MKNNNAILVLEDGTVFNGIASNEGTTTGEICFNTGMTGYQEIFTDPSYYGQIVIMTSPHIGNYGIVENEVESNSIKISGLITKSFSSVASRKVSTSNLHSYLDSSKIVSITNLDTRQIVRYIRNKGAMNAIITSELSEQQALEKVKSIPSMHGLELASKVSTKESYVLGEANKGKKIAVLDFGVKKNILNNFIQRNCICKVFPYNANINEINDWQPDAFFLSNGPGDPSVMSNQISEVKKLYEMNKPVFGICLGHQILALSAGLKTYKMHNGHRGLNHPVKNLISGKLEVTSQNHGFAVSADGIKDNNLVELTHINLNDNTVEGLKFVHKPFFSVQYHPESSPGPHDSTYLFDEFLKLI